MSTPRSRALAVASSVLLGTFAAVTNAQCPPVRVVSPEGADAYRFGTAVASNASEGGNQWVIVENGRVWAYDLMDGQLFLRQELRMPHPFASEFFGGTVAIEGDRLVVGAWSVQWPDRPDVVGGAFAYDLVDGRWVHSGDLKPPTDLSGAGTGAAVTIDGGTVLARGGPDRSVIIYEPRNGGWDARQTILPPSGVTADADFGYPIAASHGWLFVAANRDSSVASLGGSVFAYHRDTEGVYQLVQKIDGPASASFPVGQFGWDLDFDGRTLAIGAQSSFPAFDDQGVTFVFELEDGTWTPRQALTHRGAQARDAFGPEVAVEGDRMLVVAWRERTSRSDSMVYAFERGADGLWRQGARLLPTPTLHAVFYGADITLHGDYGLITAHRECEPGSSDQTGAAYLFDLSCYECPDLDADDRLTVFDYLEFMRAFDAGEPIADMDNDGELTIADFLAFQDAFAVGCP